MFDFSSLTTALEDWFDKPLHDLPEKLQKRVESGFLLQWDDWSTDQRRCTALQWDLQHNPETDQGRTYWFEFNARREELLASLEKWKNKITATVNEMDIREAKMGIIQDELQKMDTIERLASYRYVPPRKSEPLDVTFIPYLKTINLLKEKLGATPEELAAWVMLGPYAGGLRAWTNANEMNPPPEFVFMSFGMAGNYVSDLMTTWYAEEDVSTFQPQERYITGKALVERWMGSLGEHLDMFVQAKIQESRLSDLHPHVGMTQWSEPQSSATKESALFSLSEVLAIEEKDGIHVGSVKNQKGEKPLSTNERNTLLTIIAALCDYSAINLRERGTVSQIARLTEEIGAPISDDTIRNVISKVQSALESRKK